MAASLSVDTDELMSPQISPYYKVSDLDLYCHTAYHGHHLSSFDHSNADSQLSQPSNVSSVRSRSGAKSFVFASEEAFNDKRKINRHCSVPIPSISENSPLFNAHNILQQLSVDLEIEEKIKDALAMDIDIINMDNATRYFYKFLKNNKLQQYFDRFKQNECCDIRDIEYLMDDLDFLKNNIGITNPIHLRKFVGEFKHLKDKMDYFKNQSIIPDILVQKLLKRGIVTMDILCSEIECKSDLKQKLAISNDNQTELLWNVIDAQINPKNDIRYPPILPKLIPYNDNDEFEVIDDQDTPN